MNKVLFFLVLTRVLSCELVAAQEEIIHDMNKELAMENDGINGRDFLSCMYSDSYFPRFLVDKCKDVLLELCAQIEEKNPKSLTELYTITHRSTEKINQLQNEFYENNSEIETGARECLAEEFEFIAKVYGFDPDIEELIAPREW